jgi:hypothetical protein
MWWSISTKDPFGHLKDHNITIADFHRLHKSSAQRGHQRLGLHAASDPQTQVNRPHNLKQCDLVLVRLFAGCSIAPDLIGNDAFIEAIKELRRNVDYKLPSSRTLKKKIKQWGGVLQDGTRAMAQTLLSFSFGFDIWTKHGVSYLGTSLQGVDETFTRIHQACGVNHFSERHTSANILQQLAKTLKEDASLAFDAAVGMTHDSAPNNLYI